MNLLNSNPCNATSASHSSYMLTKFSVTVNFITDRNHQAQSSHVYMPYQHRYINNMPPFSKNCNTINCRPPTTTRTSMPISTQHRLIRFELLYSVICAAYLPNDCGPRPYQSGKWPLATLDKHLHLTAWPLMPKRLAQPALDTSERRRFFRIPIATYIG